MSRTNQVIEGWTGPGRRDPVIVPLKPAEDGLHIDRSRRGQYEWWYFDAHLDNGYTVVVFFHASNPNPGLEGQTGIEVVLLRPDGIRIQRFFPHNRSEFAAAADKPEVTIGKNTLRTGPGAGGLPVYAIDVDEAGLGCHLTYQAEVDGWKPGTGLSQFGHLGSFGWVVPFVRASVKGTITDGDITLPVSGTGYHDHNWLNFPFPTVIRYWMWGRIYSEHFSAAYAYIQCNQKVGEHAVKVLMLADGKEVILSTGEFEFRQEDFEFNPRAKYEFPRQITIDAPGEMRATLKAKRILEAQDMLANFSPLLRFLARNLLRMQPGYFRLLSDFELEVSRCGEIRKETGETLHEIVLFTPVRGASA